MYSSNGAELPARLWTMLSRSPNLQDLAFVCPKPLQQTFNIFPLADLHWPNLKSLRLTTLAYHETAAEYDKFATFLSAHSSLEDVRLEHPVGLWNVPNFYIPETLPKLRSFMGTLRDLERAKALLNLQSVTLVMLHSPSMPFLQILRRYPNISRLFVQLDTPDLDVANHLKFYACLLNLPKLRHLDLSTRCTVDLNEFSLALCNSTKLETLMLTRFHNTLETENEARTGAAHIFGRNLTLMHLVVRDAVLGESIAKEVAEYDRVGDGQRDCTVVGRYSMIVDFRTQSAVVHTSNIKVTMPGAGNVWEILRHNHGGHVPIGGGGSSTGVHTSNCETDLSLMVNYLPSKFSHTPLLPSASLSRKAKGGKAEMNVPKRGGGVEAFRSLEARMPGQEDDDYDGVQGRTFEKDGAGKKGEVELTTYALIALVFSLLTWCNDWHHTDIILVGNRWAGILLSNRSFLAIYTFMLWVTFAFLVEPGYIAYHRQAFNLEGKTSAQWSRTLGADGRARIQIQLKCCGYFSPFVEAMVTQTCYARSVLPGCKKVYINYEHEILTRFYAAAFVLVPAHILVMVVDLLCSNHVTYRFGKGMMPKAYGLSLNSMAVIMDNYANQLADQYGSEMVSEILARSRSNVNLGRGAGGGAYSPHHRVYHAKYGSVGGRAPEGAL
ncbi:hypothetical protein DXG01_011629 [Tephrocybe rancida]|nr:hypothetical protein DXG01_011629 [Tephrocybe rancida]